MHFLEEGTRGCREHGKRKGKRDLPPLEEEEGDAGGSRKTGTLGSALQATNWKPEFERRDPATEHPLTPTLPTPRVSLEPRPGLQ